MLLEKLHVIIAIVAALIVTVFSFFFGKGFYENSIWLIITIISFYFIGLIVRYYLRTHIFPAKEETETTETDNENMPDEEMPDE